MLSYQKVKTWAQKSGIKSSSEWARKAKENKIPKNIPKAPDSYYKRRGLWETWGIFLGTKIVANQNKKSIIRPFKEALKWVHTQDVKDKNGWKKLCQSKNFPKDIPKTPMNAYPNELKGKGMGYWYGTNKKSTHDIDWRPFKKARKYVQDLEFQNTTEYRKWATTDQKPQDIPTAPKRIYKKEWKGWEDWLGNKERKQKKYLDYSKAKKWAQSKKIPSGTVWRKLVSQKKIPKDIPGAPDKKYEEWEGWPKFLGTIIEKMTYEEASQFVQSKKIIGDTSFREYKKKNKLPKNFPRAPDNYYKKQGTWKGWGDFCGTGRVSTLQKSEETLPWSVAKKLYQKIKRENNLTSYAEFRRYASTHELPKGLPKNPDIIYSEERVSKRMDRKND